MADSYTCPVCGWKTYHPKDIPENFCPKCDCVTEMTAQQIFERERRDDDLREAKLDQDH